MNAAILFNPDNYKELAETIWKVIEDKELKQSLVEEGLKHIQKYSLENTAINTLAAYELANSLMLN